jgi:hypothetical protein
VAWAEAVPYDVGNADIVLHVAAGTYDESVYLTMAGTDPLLIEGAGASSTVIDDQGDEVGLDNESQDRNITVEGFSITGNGQVNRGVGGVVNDIGGGLTLTDDVISGNTAQSSAFYAYGGGVSNDQGAELTLDDDVISDNTTIGAGGGDGLGGGVYNAGTITVEDDTFSNNSVSGGSGYLGDGGGMFNSGTATVTNSTFSNNTATGGHGNGQGGAIENEVGANLTITDATLSDNSAVGGASSSGLGGGIYNAGTAFLANSVLVDSSCSGTISDDGYNVDSDDSCGLGPYSLTDIGTSAIGLASTLAANGSAGPPTLAIGPSSAAYAEVPPSAAAATGTLGCTVDTDQRGDLRPGVLPNCDAGAFEYQTVPGVPSIGTAIPGNGEAAVSFAPPVMGGTGISSYTVNATDETDPARGDQSAQGGASPITVSGLTNGDSYTFTVSATNAEGTGMASASSNPVTPANDPASPTNLTATGGTAEVKLRWIAPAADGGSPLIGYNIYKATTTGGESTTPTNVVPVASTTYTVTGLTIGTDYYFTVKAVNAVGVSAGSNEASATPIAPPPVNRRCSVQLPNRTVVGLADTPDGAGYWIASSTGAIAACGDARVFSSVTTPRAPIVAIAAAPVGQGYWLADSKGDVYAFGSAVDHGGIGNVALNTAIVAMAADPATGGYWLLGGDGGVFSFDAPFYGSTGDIRLQRPAVGMVASPNGGGYWFVASDGGVFAYGHAGYHGSVPGILKPRQTLDAPIVGMAADPVTGGYWLDAADGGIFGFDAPFLGSTGGVALDEPCVGMIATQSGGGYRFVAADGGVFNFGTAGFYGSAAT